MALAKITIKSDVDIQRLPVDTEEQTFNNWNVKYTKSHILHSQCTTAEKCAQNSQETCPFCVYTNSLELPHLPEMVFPNNILTLTHNSSVQIEFNALDALKTVCNGRMPLKVAYADEWKESRPATYTEEKFKPFDWTFSNDYKGTITGPVIITDTEERINIERLKEKEKILFYQELMLYEDELHDNGIASCTVKIRVMPSSFFILLRYFLRVDNVMVRVNDTRYFHDFETNYVLREFTNKECAIKDIQLPYTVFGDPNVLSPHMPLRIACYHKITWSTAIEEKSPDDVLLQCTQDNSCIITPKQVLSNVNSEGDAL